jgi:hypothetical protein
MPTAHRDFVGIYPYKWIIPIISWSSLVLMLIGPVLFPNPWFRVVIGSYFLYFVVAGRQMWRLIVSTIKVRSTIINGTAEQARLAAEQQQRIHVYNQRENGTVYENGNGSAELALDIGHEFVHVFIIPNYCEPLQLLEATLDGLAGHPKAKARYIVCLAMEEKEKGHEQKAHTLMDVRWGLCIHPFIPAQLCLCTAYRRMHILSQKSGRPPSLLHRAAHNLASPPHSPPCRTLAMPSWTSTSPPMRCSQARRKASIATSTGPLSKR